MAEKSIAIEKLSHRLTGQDATFIYGESRNGPLHVGSLSFFEDEITYPELIRHFESKLPSGSALPSAPDPGAFQS